jgi:hypothetical protein
MSTARGNVFELIVRHQVNEGSAGLVPRIFVRRRTVCPSSHAFAFAGTLPKQPYARFLNAEFPDTDHFFAFHPH